MSYYERAQFLIRLEAKCYFCDKTMEKAKDVFLFRGSKHFENLEKHDGAPLYGAHRPCAVENMNKLEDVAGSGIPHLKA